MTEIDPTNVSTAYLAECLGMTRDGVTRLCRGGVIRQNGVARGKYNLYDAVPDYIAYLQESKGDESTVKLLRQRERKLRLQNDKTEAGLVPIADAAQVFAQAHSIFRSIHDDVFEGIAAELAKTDNPHEVSKILKDRFNQAAQVNIDGFFEAIENERKSG